MIVHKSGNETIEMYAGFGQYLKVRAPFCVGAKMVYRGRTYYMHRNWKFVTCKHCLKKYKSVEKVE